MHRLVFIYGEWHLEVPRIVFAHFVAQTLLVTYFILHGYDCASLVSSTSIISTFYIIGLFSSIVFYRLFCHGLCRFPGPKLAAATKLWHVWQSRNSTNFLVMQNVHERYGELVRTGKICKLSRDWEY
jgi:hypothetical protein